jgi:hypothetical protein
MRLNHRLIGLLLAAAALASLLMIPGCAGGSLVYDPYRRDYHRWDQGEVGFYQQWEVGSHRIHMDFNRRSAADQNAYWGWRHR